MISSSWQAQGGCQDGPWLVISSLGSLYQPGQADFLTGNALLDEQLGMGRTWHLPALQEWLWVSPLLRVRGQEHPGSGAWIWGVLENRDEGQWGWRSPRGPFGCAHSKGFPKPFPRAPRRFPSRCGQHRSCGGRGTSLLPHPLLCPAELSASSTFSPFPPSSADSSSWFLPRAAFIFLILPSHVRLLGMRKPRQYPCQLQLDAKATSPGPFPCQP